MFHASEENKLYNFTKGTQTDIGLLDKKEEVDLHGFLDDVSQWMEKHRELISSKYLPFSCLAVGLIPSHASAFVYGCFVGRAMEKKGLKVVSREQPIDQKDMAKQIKNDIHAQMNWLSNMLKHIDKETEDGKANDKV